MATVTLKARTEATANGFGRFMDKQSSRFHFPREVLVIEIERRCIFVDCHGRNQIGLTKAEAIEYRGFHCSHCERWNDDQLKQSEVPDSWPTADNSIAH